MGHGSGLSATTTYVGVGALSSPREHWTGQNIVGAAVKT